LPSGRPVGGIWNQNKPQTPAEIIAADAKSKAAIEALKARQAAKQNARPAPTPKPAEKPTTPSENAAARMAAQDAAGQARTGLMNEVVAEAEKRGAWNEAGGKFFENATDIKQNALIKFANETGKPMRPFSESEYNALVDEFNPALDPRMAQRPVKAVRLLGQDLVLFKDAQQRWGLLDRDCPHRGADLSFGRHEGDGLRCPFHGWKFDVSGRCLDTPAEPLGSRLCDRVQQASYPVVERNGAVLDSPEQLQNDPHGEGWLLVVRPSDPSQIPAEADGAGAGVRVGTSKNENFGWCLVLWSSVAFAESWDWVGP
jgi:nitrite reductase/ring-hydroxylating ferredoxin subunit